MSTWQRIKEIGSGTVDYRLEIEGWPHEWVTNPRITHAGNAAGRTVYAGLQYAGLAIKEMSDIRTGWPNVDRMTVTIVPTDIAESTMMFTRDPVRVGYLDESLEPGLGPGFATSWSTKPGTLPAGVYHMGTEAVLHDGDNLITRGHWHTGAQAHSIFDVDGETEKSAPVYSWPPTMDGRRCYLYAYGAGDSVSGDGTIIWRGIVARPPRMNSDGVSWTIALDPITKVFDQNVGGSSDISSYRVRGIYHSRHCAWKAYITTDSTSLVTAIGPIEVRGFFSGQSELLNAINAEIATALVGATGDAAHIESITFGYFGSRPYFNVKLDLPGYEFPIGMLVMDALDGTMWWGSFADPHPNGEAENAISGSINLYVGDDEGRFTVWFAPDRVGEFPLPSARCIIGEPVVEERTAQDDRMRQFIATYTGGDLSNTYPSNRVYLDSVAGLATGNVLALVDDETATATYLEVGSIDTDALWIEVFPLNASGDKTLFVSDQTPLFPVGNFGTSTNWSGFMNEIIDQAPAANLGRVPYITAEDVDNTLWPLLWSTYSFNSYWTQRNYRFLFPAKVSEVLAPELIVTGYMARLNQDGKIDVCRLPIATPNATPLYTIDDNEMLLPAEGFFGRFPTWESQSSGLVNIVKLRLGFNPVTDEHDELRDVTVRNVTSIAEHKSGNRAMQEISIRSTQADGFSDSKTPPEFAITVAPYLGSLSVDYAIVTVTVPFTLFEVLCGDLVEITSEYIPDGRGNRGVTRKKAICVGREWNLDPKSNQMGTLTFWLPRDGGTRAGYAPTGRITGQSNTSGNIWVLTFSTGNARNVDWFESDNGDVVKHFAVDDTIQIVQRDTLTPIIRYGVITAIPASNQITVNLGSSWTPGASNWYLRFWGNANAELPPTVAERQLQYCWVADESKALPDGAVAREFA